MDSSMVKYRGGGVFFRAWRAFGGVAGISFVLLFPGFFFYQTALGLGMISGVLGGYFGVVSLGVFIPLAALLFRSYFRKKVDFGISDFLFFFILLLWLLATLFGYVVGGVAGNEEMLAWGMSGILFNFVCFSMGKMLDVERPEFARVVSASLVLMFLVVVLNSRNGLFNLVLNSDAEGLATYQAFARSIAVSGLLGYSLARSFIFRLMLFAAIITSLFLNGARSEFVIFMLAIAALFFVLSVQRIRSLIVVFLCVILLIFAGNVFFDDVVLMLPETRMLQLLDLASSTSATSRLHLNEVAIDSISKNPIMGDYGSYILSEGSVGAFSHNLLSAWVNLGLIGFLCYLVALVYMVWTSVRLLHRDAGVMSKCTFLFVCFVALAYLSSKDYSYMIFGLAAGFSGNRVARVWRK